MCEYIVSRLCEKSGAPHRPSIGAIIDPLERISRSNTRINRDRRSSRSSRGYGCARSLCDLIIGIKARTSRRDKTPGVVWWGMSVSGWWWLAISLRRMWIVSVSKCKRLPKQSRKWLWDGKRGSRLLPYSSCARKVIALPFSNNPAWIRVCDDEIGWRAPAPLGGHRENRETVLWIARKKWKRISWNRY